MGSLVDIDITESAVNYERGDLDRAAQRVPVLARAEDLAHTRASSRPT
jgi:hypothetical protein